MHGGKGRWRQIDRISHAILERRLKFSGHLKRMDDRRLIKKIFSYITKTEATTT